jgi:hypothetical protein
MDMRWLSMEMLLSTVKRLPTKRMYVVQKTVRPRTARGAPSHREEKEGIKGSGLIISHLQSNPDPFFPLDSKVVEKRDATTMSCRKAAQE